ncbi:MAG TPA: hypothetical protein DCY94_02040 [Firmicutes bacterium]|nr:hypothetical protein [Bacillota bacterium]
MNSLELVNELYKPYRITKQGKATIIESMDGKFAVKAKSQKNVKELFEYLRYRNFDGFPKIVDDSRSDIDIFEYVDDVKMPSDQKALDMVRLVAKLHNKTSYDKEVREDKYKEIYESISSTLEYYKMDYERMVIEIEDHIFMSPSEYLFIRNSSKLMNQIAFCREKLDEWYESVRGILKTRVSVVHNNLSLDHYLKGEREVLISWDKSTVDTPILDIYNFYQKEALNIEFSSILKEYLSISQLDEPSKNLLLILLCLPKKFTLTDDEFSSCSSISEGLDYVFKTENLARPYYLEQDKEQ